MCWRSEVEAPNLSRIGLCCRKESGFRRISFFFVRVNLFFFFFLNQKRLNPKSMLASCKLKGGLFSDEALQKQRLLSQSNPGKPRTDQGKRAWLSSQRATMSTPGPAGPSLQTGIRVTLEPSGDSNVDASQTSFLCQDRPGYVCPRLPQFSRAQPSADSSGETPGAQRPEDGSQAGKSSQR